VLGDHRHAAPYYDRTLRDAVLGPYSRQLVSVSRYYMLLKPPVVVDFEPAPQDGKFYVEEKRKFFMARGTVYVPVFLRERLTMAEFAQRVRDARRVTEQVSKVAKEDLALRQVVAPPSSAATVSGLDLDRQALSILAGEIRRNHCLRGASRASRLRAIKCELVRGAGEKPRHSPGGTGSARADALPRPPRTRSVPRERHGRSRAERRRRS